MGKKLKKIKQPAIRVGKGSAKIIMNNNIKGVYYFQNDDGKYVVIDNTKGKMESFEYDTMEDCITGFGSS